MSSWRIPFNRASPAGRELDYVSEAVGAGGLAGDGDFTQRCARLLESELGVERALLTASCSQALEMCGLLHGLGPGDEVVVPSYAFVTTAGAFALRGVRPVFVDVRPDTLNLDEGLIASKLTSRTRAIVVLHYAGVACEMDAIGKLADEADIAVVEDAAHGLFARYRGRALGTFGSLATLSFHETKNFTCGEGGALLLNDTELVERARIIRDKGTDRQKFLRGEVDEYTWVDLGSSYLLSDLLAGFLYGQLERREEIQQRRRRIWNRYAEALSDWAERNEVGLPQVPAHCEQPYHLFYMILPSLRARDALIGHLAERGILGVFHYQPLHLSSMGRRSGGRPGDCPVTERVSECLVRLPLFASLTDEEQEEVVDGVRSFSIP